MSGIYCFFDIEKSNEFLEDLEFFLADPSIGYLNKNKNKKKKKKKKKIEEIIFKSDFEEIFEKMISLKRNEFIFVFHRDEKNIKGFKLQCLNLFPSESRIHFFNCDLHLMKGYETSGAGTLLYAELNRNDFFTTLADEALIFSLLNSLSINHANPNALFNSVERVLRKIKNVNYLLKEHLIKSMDIHIRDLIDPETLKQDKIIIGRFYRLRDKEIEGKNRISNRDEEKHFFSLDISFNKVKTFLEFDFSQIGLRKTRIITLVGKNATGKSQTLLQIAKGDLGPYTNNTFLYGFDERKNHTKKNYKYTNLINTRGDNLKHDIGRIIELDQKVFYFQRIKLLEDVAKNILGIKDIILFSIDGDIVSLFSPDVKNVESILRVEVIPKNTSHLSTGQEYFLKFIVSFISNINYFSLLLIDEPEVFLHPNYIKDLIHILERVLTYTNSACVLSTHSVFIIREMPKEYVKILYKDRNGNEVKVRIPAQETFGESLDILAEDIFHDEDIEGMSDQYAKKGNLDLKYLSSRLASRVMNND